ncbi:hypothetical protein Pmani_016414 [Petrolisthes manimaculis]|uniref:Uncharacterized protein n=1 Tax=Petrolisthes manimaculis TaxID=1843537 RepID=A0AAE1PP59_9EUCA|nr:hypothetical protein Pmani_016414 [Petrolisthes manimaculis]
MNFFAVIIVSLVLMVSVSQTTPSSSYGAPVIPILKDDRSQDRYGAYTFDYRTGNGIYRNEAGRQNYGQNSEGGWSYTSPEGVPVKISFVANKGGFQAVGSVLPTPPPLPYTRSQRY